MDAATVVPLEEWRPVPEAARLAGLPARSVYRWVKSGSLRAKADGKKLSVELHEVQRIAAARPQTGQIVTLPLPGSAGALPAGAPMAGGVAHVGPHSLDGPLAALLFEQFDSGVAPADVVRAKELSPAVVLAAHETWRRMRDAGGKPEPRPSEVAAAVRKEIQAVAVDLERFREALGEDLGQRGAVVASLAQQVAQLSAALRQTIEGLNALSGQVEFLRYVASRPAL